MNKHTPIRKSKKPILNELDLRFIKKIETSFWPLILKDLAICSSEVDCCVPHKKAAAFIEKSPAAKKLYQATFELLIEVLNQDNKKLRTPELVKAFVCQIDDMLMHVRKLGSDS